LAAEFVAVLEVLYRSAALLGMVGVNVIIDEVDELDPKVNIGRFIKAVHERLQQQGITDVTLTLTGQARRYPGEVAVADVAGSQALVNWCASLGGPTRRFARTIMAK
jgi:hypothetical protein